MKKSLFIFATASLICMACHDESTQSPIPPADSPCEGEDCKAPDEPIKDEPVQCEDDNCGDKPEDCTGDACDNDETCKTEDCIQDDEHCEVCAKGDKRCDGSNLMVCNKIEGSENNCAEWQIAETCQSGTRCDAASLSCKACAEVCPEANKKCLENGIAVCEPDENGCAVWKETSTCEGNTHCDEATFSCVSGCVDQCESGKTRCYNGSQIQTCSKTSDGCLDWNTTETCEFAKTCTEKRVSCDYACGDSCDPFSIVIIPDSQYYTLDPNDLKTGGGTTAKQTQWVVDNQSKYNIKFVMHMGDAANDNKDYQYDIIEFAYKTLGQNGIPFTIATGNHEYKQGDSGQPYAARSRSLFSKHINPEYIKDIYKGQDLSWFKGFYANDSMYATFEVGELKFAVIALEYAPRKSVLCWADKLIQTDFRDRYVILTTHAYLRSDGRGEANSSKEKTYSYFDGKTVTRGRHPAKGNPWGHYSAYGASGEEIYKELAARHSNVIMIASGHFCEVAHRDRPGYNNNNIHETVVDYQCEKPCLNGDYAPCCEDKALQGTGNGWLRLITIDPKNKLNSDGKLAPNAQARTFSALEKYQNKALMYCSNKETYGKDLYNKSPTGAEHSYDFTIDFSKPIEYKYTNNDDFSFGNRVINTKGSGNQYYPVVAMNKQTNAFVAVWEDDYDKTDGDGNHDIEAQIYCAGGCNDQPQFTVNNVTKGQQRRPDVDMDKDGNFVVVWEDDYQSDGTYQIYMRGFDKNGKERFKTTTVNSVSDGQQYLPAVAVAPDGHFVVAWEDYSNGPEHPQIYIRGFNADGTELFHDKNTMDSVAGTRKDPDVAIAPDGSFVVTWVDDTDGNRITQIYAKAFNADGTERIKAFTVNKLDAGNQYAPSIGMNSKGDFYIAYDNQQSSSVHNIMVRGYDKNKNIIFDDTIVSGTDKLDSTPSPSICLSDDRMAAVTWKALYKETDDLEYGDIRRMTIGKDGKLSSISTIHHNRAGIQESPNIACSSSGRHVIVFSDDSDENGYTEIFGSGYNGQ